MGAATESKLTATRAREALARIRKPSFALASGREDDRTCRNLWSDARPRRPGRRPGLRHGEVLGLRWSDIDLVKGTLTVRKIRVIVDGKVLEGEPKTERGKRTLPLGEDLVAGADRAAAPPA
jgi:integrase